MTFLEALDEIKAEDSIITERIAPAGRLKAEPDGLHVAGERMPYSGKAFEQFCDRLRHATSVPAWYLGSLPGTIAAGLIGIHLEKGLEGGDAIALYSRGPDVIG